jgi:hypothetical protein
MASMLMSLLPTRMNFFSIVWLRRPQPLRYAVEALIGASNARERSFGMSK